MLAAAGRVSDRVARVVLESGTGTATEARLAGGTFAVVSDGAAAGGGTLVSYDEAGTVIDRRGTLAIVPRAGQPLASEPSRCTVAGTTSNTDVTCRAEPTTPHGEQPAVLPGCYTDPTTGAVVYGTPGGACRPAERWAPPSSGVTTG
jgi:hypothetical protein